MLWLVSKLPKAVKKYIGLYKPLKPKPLPQF